MKPKSTGWRSTNSHFYGHIASIAEQLSEPGRTITPQMVKHAILYLLMEEGEWPGAEVAGVMEPLDWHLADASLANAAVDYCHAFADTHGLWLMEYYEGGVAGKCWYGSKPEGA